MDLERSMDLKWSFSEIEKQKVRNLVESHIAKKSPATIDRKIRNVESVPLTISEEQLWYSHMMCLLTSVQRSGPRSHVMRFLALEPFPLTLSMCRDTKDSEEFIGSQLRSFGGIRFTDEIPRRAGINLRKLEAGGWGDCLAFAQRLAAQRKESPHPAQYKLESEAANYLDDNFIGFGPKQSRNFWQSLGLSRYLFVLDSRMVKWVKINMKIANPILNEGFWSGNGLGDRSYYLFLSEILMDLCIQAEVLPCMLDAAVFDSFDEN